MNKYPEYAQAEAGSQPRNMEPIFNIEQVAEVCHEANRVLQRIIGDDVSPAWKDAPEWQRESALAGVKQMHDGRKLMSESNAHDSWMEAKLRAGWTYGPVKDGEKKTHPCLLPWQALPLEQKTKDSLFVGVVSGMTRYRK